jgi:type I restriction enzyme S subunit
VTAVLARVSELAEQVRGVSYGKGDARDAPEEGYLPVLRAGNISDTGIVFDDFVYVPEALVSKKQLLRAGDVLIAASSGSLDVVGKAAPVLADFEGGFGAFCKVLRPKTACIDTRYFSHFFRTPEYRRIVSGLAAGANINNLRNEHLDDLLIPLPPLAEQRRIAAILDTADALRTKRRDALTQLDRLAQSIFVEMFGDPVTNPKGWRRPQLGEIFGIARGGSPRPIDDYITDAADGVNWIMIGDTEQGGKYIWSTKKKIRPEGVKRSRLVKSGDFLLTNSMSFGRPYILKTNGCIHDGWLVLSPQITDFNADYFYTLLGSQAVFTEFSRRAAGATVKNLNIDLVSGVEVAVPPLDEQRKFARAVEAIEAMKSCAESSGSQLDSLFGSLQARAFSGEL